VARDAYRLKYNDVYTKESKGAKTPDDLKAARRKAADDASALSENIRRQNANARNPEHIADLDGAARVNLDDHALLKELGADPSILNGIKNGDTTAQALAYLLREAKDWAPLRKTLVSQIREGRGLQDFRDMGAVDNATFGALKKAAEKFGESQELTVFGSYGTDLVTFANRHMLVAATRAGRINLHSLMAAYGRGGEAMVLGRIVPDMAKVGGPFSDAGDFDFAVYRSRDNSLPGNEALVWNKDQQVVQAEIVKKLLPDNKQHLPADFDYAKYENEVLRGFDTSYRGRARFGFDESTQSYQFLGRVQSLMYGEGGAILRDFPEFFGRGPAGQKAQAGISARFNVENLERIGWWTAGIPYFWNDLAQRSQSTNQWFNSGDLKDYGSLATLYLRGVGTFVGAFARLIGPPPRPAASATSYNAYIVSAYVPHSYGIGSFVPVPPAPPSGIGPHSGRPDLGAPMSTVPSYYAVPSTPNAPSTIPATISPSTSPNVGPLGFAELSDAVLFDLPFAQPALLNGAFDASTANGRPTLWQSFGNVAVVSGRAVLSETAGRLYSDLSQTFIVPSGARRLSLTITIDQLRQIRGQPGDAFEVALLDAETGLSLAGTARNLTETDTVFNLQADGTRRLSSAASISANNGNTLTLSIDLSGIDAGTAATLYLDLISFGTADSSVSIDDVQIVTGPSLSVGLDPSTDGGILGDNLTNVSPIILIGTTQPLQAVTLDLDGDGFDDGTTTADDTGQFQFRGILLRDGENPIRLQATSADGSALLETLIVLDRTAPRFLAADINRGAAQRSMVSTLVLRFSEDVAGTFVSDDLVLRNFTTGVDVEASLIRRDVQTDRSIVLSFPDLTGGSLADGNYLLAFRHSGITDAAGNRLEGDVQVSFFRYFGDSDGDRDVDYLDAFRLRDVLRNVGSTTASLEIFDRNADSILGADDLSAFQIRQLTFLPPLPPGTRLDPKNASPANTPGKLAERRGNPTFSPTARATANPGLLRRLEPAKPPKPETTTKQVEPTWRNRASILSRSHKVSTTTSVHHRSMPVFPQRIEAGLARTPTSRDRDSRSPLTRSETSRIAVDDVRRMTPMPASAAKVVNARPLTAAMAALIAQRSELPPLSHGTDGSARNSGGRIEPSRSSGPISAAIADIAWVTPGRGPAPLLSPPAPPPVRNDFHPTSAAQKRASKPTETRPSASSEAMYRGLQTIASPDLLLRQLAWESVVPLPPLAP